MGKDPIKDLFTGIGAMVEIFNVAYTEFIKIGYPHDKAVDCAKATLSVMLNMNRNQKEDTENDK